MINDEANIYFLWKDGLPVGRKYWITSERFCEGDKRQQLTLTKCSEDEFTCNDGSCQPLENRCDLKQDCEDKSDEIQCQKVVIDGEFSQFAEKILNIFTKNIQRDHHRVACIRGSEEIFLEILN